jgi:hypothetical protein
MERRARELAEEAVEEGHAWIRQLGPPPLNPATRRQWMAAISVVAAYRDRWNVGHGDRPLGSEGAVKTLEEMDHRARAQSAAHRALTLTNEQRAESTEVAIAVGTLTWVDELEL